MSSTEKTPPCPQIGQEPAGVHEQHLVDALDEIPTAELRREVRRRRKVEASQQEAEATAAVTDSPLLLDQTQRDPHVGPCPPWCIDAHLPKPQRYLDGHHRGGRAKVGLRAHQPWATVEVVDGHEVDFVMLAYAAVELQQHDDRRAPTVLLHRRENLPEGNIAGRIPGSAYYLSQEETLALAAELVRLVDVAAGTAGEAS